MNERVERMTFLRRRNAGRLRAPEFLARLSDRLRRPITSADLQPLERTDALWDVARPALHACRAGQPPAFSTWSPEAMSELAAGLVRVAEALPASTVLYLPSLSSALVRSR